MLSSAIKNSIIMIMIIFVFHFLIKNYLYDKCDKVVSPEKRISEQDNNKQDKESFQNVDISVKNCPDQSVPSVPFQPTKPIEPDFTVKQNDKDMMRFVLGDDTPYDESPIPMSNDKKENNKICFKTLNNSSFDKDKMSDGLEPANTDGYAYLDEAFSAKKMSE